MELKTIIVFQLMRERSEHPFANAVALLNIGLFSAFTATVSLGGPQENQRVILGMGRHDALHQQ